MSDVETNSLWPQILGECIKGKMENSKLILFNSSHTTFAKFKEMFPNGKLLKKPEKGKAESHYQKYFESEGRYGIFGRQYKFDRIGQKEIVYGLRLPCKTVAVSQKFLEANGEALITCDEQSYKVIYDKATQTVHAEGVPVMTSFWFAWINFFPETELIALEE